MMKKSVGKKLIIIIIIVCLLAGLGVGGFAIYNNYKAQAEIQTLCDGIAEEYKSFENAQSRDEKLDILSNMIEESNKYTGSEKVKAEYEECIALMKSFFAEDYDERLAKAASATIDEISGEDRKTLISDLEELKADIEKEAYISLDESEKEEYIALIDSSIEKIHESFKSEYDKILEDNTIENVESVEDKELLEGCINNLKDFKDKLEDDFSQEYTQKADALIESYEDRIKDIEEAEAQAKKQEEEKQQETQQEYSEEDYQDTDYTDESYSDGAEDNNYEGSDDNWHGGLHHTFTNHDTGVTSYFYNDGYCYNTLGDEGNWKELQ